MSVYRDNQDFAPRYINRLLRQGISKKVISQVLNQAVEALAKQANAHHRAKQ